MEPEGLLPPSSGPYPEPIHTTPSYLPKIHFNITRPPTSCPSYSSLLAISPLSYILSHILAQFPSCRTTPNQLLQTFSFPYIWWLSTIHEYCGHAMTRQWSHVTRNHWFTLCNSYYKNRLNSERRLSALSLTWNDELLGQQGLRFSQRPLWRRQWGFSKCTLTFNGTTWRCNPEDTTLYLHSITLTSRTPMTVDANQ
jgi:hypothetical protein